MPNVYWSSVLETDHAEVLFPNGKSFPCLEGFDIHLNQLDVVQKKTSMTRVLDFGSGMGRNTMHLFSFFQEVYTFDTSHMAEAFRNRVMQVRMSRPYLPEPVIHDDFFRVLDVNYDVVFDSVCFQHVHPLELLPKLYWLAIKAPFIMSFTRNYHDYTRGSVIKLVEKSRVWRKIDERFIRFIGGEAHYSVLYESTMLKR